MITRIVKMTFKETEIEQFKAVFDAAKSEIRNFPGVEHLELLQGTKAKNIFFTYSYWRSEEDLENYKQSTLFKNTWANTKPLFKEKAEAWSTECLHRLK